MAFLKKRLEEITSFTLDIIPMLEFVEGLCALSSQDTKHRSTLFLNEWQNNVYMKSLTLVYINGSWKPLSSSSKELRKQLPWDEYLKRNFALSKSKLSVSVENKTLFNFEELVDSKFWKDLYENFGIKTVSFIFDRSLILSEVEESFFVLIGSDKCNLSQKISKLSSVLQKKQMPATDVQTSNSANPYQISTGNTTKTSDTSSNNNKRKLSNAEDLNVQFHKKIRIDNKEVDGLQERMDFQPSGSSRTIQSISEDNPLGIIRWFIPKEKDLQFLINERERMKVSSGISSMTHNVEGQISEMNFVGIIQDAQFRKLAHGNEKAILKQSCKIKFPVRKLPSDWEGLKIPNPPSDSNQSMYVTVFKISETFAKTYNIRIKVKQRRKTKITESSNNPTVLGLRPLNVSESQNPQAGSSNGVIKESLSHIQENSRPEINSFDPLMFLPTSLTLYNKSSWSRWPSDHVMVKACSTDSTTGVKLLREDIFKNTDAGVRDKEKSITYASSLHMSELSKILDDIVTFHRRVKDIHKLVKSCLTFWMIKKQDKMDKREKKKIDRQEWRALNPMKPNGTNIQPAPIEMIDLTVDTPSTSTPTPDMFADLNNTSVHVNRTLRETSLNSSKYILSEQADKKKRRTFAYSRLKEKVSHSCLLMMLKQICHVSKTEKLLGSKKNCRGFFTFLRKSIILAGTKSSLQLGQLMALLNPMDCKWLSPLPDSAKSMLLSKAAVWLFKNYFMVILRLSFYITEVNDSRLHASFYLRESWKSISEHVKRRFISAGNLQSLGSGTSRKSQMKRSNENVNARIRFLPKKNHDLRPILSLKRDCESRINLRRNKMLINYIVRQNSPHRIRDPNVIKLRWVQFLQDWKAAGHPKLFFVRADIQDAYPSVNMEKLLEILHKNTCDIGMMTLKDFKVISSTRVLYRNTLVCDKSRDDWNASILIRPCIVQDTKRLGSKLNPVEVANQITSCFKENVVRVGKNKYTFQYGLPQGWVLSEGLCSIYYGSMDSKYFSEFLGTKGEFFMTSVDDYFYVTPNPKRAWKFWKKMQTGIPEYSCHSNSSKMISNLHPRSDLVIPDQECEWVNFCGWKFCLSCGHIMRDFSSYVGQDMASTISFIPRNLTSPENFLIGRMKVMLPARLHQFLLDPAINCRERIIMNVYEAGLIFAFRFYAICRVIYPNLNAVKEPHRRTSIVSAIYTCVKTLTRMVVRTSLHNHPAKPSHIMCKKEDNRVKLCPCVNFYVKDTKSKKKPIPITTISREDWSTSLKCGPLEESEIFFIVYHAFIQKLMNHSQVFKDEIVPKLQKMKSYQKSQIDNAKYSFLIEVLGSKMPIHFQKIRI